MPNEVNTMNNKLNIRYISDLHLEICPYVLPYGDDEQNTILILAGDIVNAGRLQGADTVDYFIENICQRFRMVIGVSGNHESYGGDITLSDERIRHHFKNYDNFHWLQKDVLMVDDVAFIGATLWTDMMDRNEGVMNYAQTSMNDYYVITYNEFKTLEPADTVMIHDNHKKFIFDSIADLKNKARKIVVVTHHAPSYQSVAPEFVGNFLNGAFYSDLDESIKEHSPDLWIHGHTHSSMDYMIGDTRVVCNPRGYARLIGVNNFNKMCNEINQGKIPSLDFYEQMTIFRNENGDFDPWKEIEL